MNPPDLPAALALDAIVEQCLDEQRLVTEHDPAWPSACELDLPDRDGRIRWRPVRRDAFDALDPLAETLGIELHPALRTYYGRWFSDGFATLASEGEVQLLGVWSPEDNHRLLENLLGHALQQRRLRQSLTFFFACTEPDSDLVLSVDNDRGTVVLEAPGTDRREDVAPDLASFLARLQPQSDTAP